MTNFADRNLIMHTTNDGQTNFHNSHPAIMVRRDKCTKATGGGRRGDGGARSGR